jgi:ribosomal silencing factor RsfS
LSGAIKQHSAEDVLIVDVLVLADDCTPYKCCIICSLTSYEKIKKFAHTEAENTEK